MYAIDCRRVFHDIVIMGSLPCIKVCVEMGNNRSINVKTGKYESGISEEGDWTPLDLAYFFRK